MAEHARAHKVEQEENLRENLRDLIRWLSLIPVVLLFLTVCGQLALTKPKSPAADTRSLLQADYQPWPFIVFRPVNPAIVQEIMQDQGPENRLEQPVVTGSIWLIPTPTKGKVAFIPTSTREPEVTQDRTPTEPPPPTNTATLPAIPTSTKTLSHTPTYTATLTRVPIPTATKPVVFVPSSTPKPRHPKRTSSPTATSTGGPTFTLTQTTSPTGTPTPTYTLGPSPTHTPTVPAPIATFTPTSSPAITPTDNDPGHRLRIIPIQEGAAVRNPDGSCTATWGYQNPNSFTVIIPVNGDLGSPLNRFFPSPADRGQPSTFLPGRQKGAFTTTWSSGRRLIWVLDRHFDVAGWCW